MHRPSAIMLNKSTMHQCNITTTLLHIELLNIIITTYGRGTGLIMRGKIMGGKAEHYFRTILNTIASHRIANQSNNSTYILSNLATVAMAQYSFITVTCQPNSRNIILSYTALHSYCTEASFLSVL